MVGCDAMGLRFAILYQGNFVVFAGVSPFLPTRQERKNEASEASVVAP
jgi:hypothetical protein